MFNMLENMRQIGFIELTNIFADAIGQNDDNVVLVFLCAGNGEFEKKIMDLLGGRGIVPIVICMDWIYKEKIPPTVSRISNDTCTGFRELRECLDRRKGSRVIYAAVNYQLCWDVDQKTMCITDEANRERKLAREFGRTTQCISIRAWEEKGEWKIYDEGSISISQSK